MKNFYKMAEEYADKVILHPNTYRGDVVTAYVCGCMDFQSANSCENCRDLIDDSYDCKKCDDGFSNWHPIEPKAEANNIEDKPYNVINEIHLPLSPEHRLVRWANYMRGYYGFPIYLVGSALTKKMPRDIDVCCIIPDALFCQRYHIEDIQQHVSKKISGIWNDEHWRWSDDVMKKVYHGWDFTHMNIDFKVISEAESKEQGYMDKPKLQLDTRAVEFSKAEAKGGEIVDAFLSSIETVFVSQTGFKEWRLSRKQLCELVSYATQPLPSDTGIPYKVNQDVRKVLLSVALNNYDVVCAESDIIKIIKKWQKLQLYY
jgi:hypothetical protein